MKLPSFSVYANYSSRGYGAHALMFTDAANNDFYFSYETLVAFRGPTGLVVRENDWGPTTGKHLNAIDDGNKKARVSAEVFQRKFAEAFGKPLSDAA